MMQRVDQDLSIAELVIRYWRMMICIVIGSITLAGLATTFMPKKYESRMKLLVKNERADLVIRPDKSSSPPMQGEVTEAQVNSEIELLRSRNILEAIVNDEKLYRVQPAHGQTAPSRLDIDRAVIRLQRDLNVGGIRKTNLIQVSYRATDPNLAAQVVRDLGDKYLSEHVAVHSAPGSYVFFSDQVEKYQQELNSIKAALSRFHRKNRVFLLPQQESVVVEQMQRGQAQVKDLDAQIREQETRLREAHRQLATTEERVTTQVRQMPSQGAAERLQTELNSLENRRIDLAMKYKPEDRLLKEVESEIANTRQTLAQVRAGTFREETSDLSRLHEALKAEAMQDEVALKGLRTRRLALSANVGDYLTQLASLDKDAVSLSDLEERQKQAEENVLLYSRRLEESRLADSLDREKFANVAVVEAPVPSVIPVSPDLKLNLVLGGALGLMLAVGAAFLVNLRGRVVPERAGKPLETHYASRRVVSTASGD